MMRNPDANIDDMPIDELTKMTREYLDKEFMLEFIDKGANALRNSREVSFEKKRELLPKIDKAIEFFNIELIEESEAKAVVKDLAKEVVFAIDKLEIVKNSAEYTFTSSINMAVAKFFAAIKNNPKEQARFDKQTAKRDKLVAAGKESRLESRSRFAYRSRCSARGNNSYSRKLKGKLRKAACRQGLRLSDGNGRYNRLP